MTTPEKSQPKMHGRERGYNCCNAPVRSLQSVGFTPAACHGILCQRTPGASSAKTAEFAATNEEGARLGYLHLDEELALSKFARQVAQLYFQLVGRAVFVQRDSQHFRGRIVEVNGVCGRRWFKRVDTLPRCTPSEAASSPRKERDCVVHHLLALRAKIVSEGQLSHGHSAHLLTKAPMADSPLRRALRAKDESSQTFLTLWVRAWPLLWQKEWFQPKRLGKIKSQRTVRDGERIKYNFSTIVSSALLFTSVSACSPLAWQFSFKNSTKKNKNKMLSQKCYYLLIIMLILKIMKLFLSILFEVFEQYTCWYCVFNILLSNSGDAPFVSSVNKNIVYPRYIKSLVGILNKMLMYAIFNISEAA